MDRILNACTRPTLANAAVYQYSRGGNGLDPEAPLATLAQASANTAEEPEEAVS